MLAEIHAVDQRRDIAILKTDLVGRSFRLALKRCQLVAMFAPLGTALGWAIA